MRPSPTRSAQPWRDGGLGDVGQPVLQGRVARADQDGLRAGGFDLADGVDLAGHAHQRIFGRQVAVGGREVGRALDVRVVVRAAGGQADQVHAQPGQHLHQGDGLGQVDAQAGAVAAKGVGVAAGLRKGPNPARRSCPRRGGRG